VESLHLQAQRLVITPFALPPTLAGGGTVDSWYVNLAVSELIAQKFHLELSIGEDPTDSQATDQTKQVLGDMATRLRELNGRVASIRREQQYQREREAEFRDTSELTNSRVVWWTVAQLAILAFTALWQMRHLKSFFVSKKLV